ncbi:MAG: sugar ABC transporter ATP-binding protein [Spirochaetia bacterium]|jgi:ribose transport system ATP-binding protein
MSGEARLKESQEPILRMEQIDKRFPGVHALNHVDFELLPGEVHVLLGENGAGKSTLMKVLSGSIQSDSGRISILGKPVHNLSPEYARALGVGMVYQELSLVPALSVAENIFLGKPHKSRLGGIDWRAMYREAEKSLADLGLSIDPRTEVRRLDVAEQQLTEIARILTARPRIVLLDEPTSALSDAERERLFALIHLLRDRGVGIVYISHRLAEVPLIGQRVTVMRDGRVIGNLAVKDADEPTLVNMMVGRRLTEQFPKEFRAPGRRVFKVEDLSMKGSLRSLSLELREGEILGIFGLMGAGQPELTRAIFGLDRKGSGRIWVDDDEVHIHRPADAIRHGIGLLTRDRRMSLVPALPIPPNVTLANVSQLRMHRRLRLRSEARRALDYVRSLSINPPSLSRAVMFLSGGNQQKVVLARWLCSGAKILIFDEPTRGIDVGAKAEVFALMNQLTGNKAAIVMISSEMPEILAMADRILVMRGGRFTAEFARGEATQEKLLRAAS